MLKISQKKLIMADLDIKKFDAGDIVIHTGLVCAAKLFIVVSGRVLNSKTGVILADKGNCIGDMFIGAARSEVKYQVDYIAGCNMKVAQINTYQIEVAIGGKYEQIIKENAAIDVLRRISLFSAVKDPQMPYLLSIMTIRKYTDMEVALSEGMFFDSVFVVKRGKIDVFNNGVLVKSIAKLGYFGERGIVSKELSKYSYVSSGNSTLWIVSKNSLNKLVNPKMIKYVEDRIERENEDSVLEELSVVDLLGKSLYSRVYLVRTPLGLLYALKVYSLAKIKKLCIYQQVIVIPKQNEKQVLSRVDHHFIVRFIKSYKDSKRIYLLLEYVKGLDLETILRNTGLLSTDEAVFYIASLITVLQYLHDQDILYRDLKPNNIMVGEDGFIKLIDFNSAKITEGRTYTLVGCPYYTAPEVIAGKGFSKNSEIWSLGVLLYEFLCGRVPFGSTQEDPFKVYEEILKNPVIFPEDIPLMSEASISLVRQLLSKYSGDRHSGPIERLKKHEFFVNFEWDMLYSKSITPPFKPVVPEMWEASDENLEESKCWDGLIENDSQDSSNSLPELCDDDVDIYKESIPHDWDRYFI